MLAQFFKTNMVLVNFVYPLIFFLMGFGILLKNTVHSRFYLAKSLQFLAFFGILHGISDWGNIFIPIQKAYLSEDSMFVLDSVKLLTNAVSFFFLFYFGLHLLVQTKKLNWKILLIPICVLALWFASFIFLGTILVTEQNKDWWFAISDIWARYLLAFPGGALSSYALFAQRHQFQSFGAPIMTRTLLVAAVSVGLYAITGGVVVPYAPVLPAMLFNSNLFFTTTGIPVELFRGLSGFLMALFILKILKVFDLEYQHYFYQAERDKAVAEERNQIARDLHDGMIQSIYAIGLRLEIIRNMLADKNAIEQSEAELHNVIGKLNNIIREIRDYIKKLKIPADLKLNMKEEIEKLVAEMKVGHQLEIDLKYDYRDHESLPLSQSVQIYYIIKEALSNIIRHAEASQATIVVKGNPDDLVVEVIDNGRGIENLNDVFNKEECDFLKQGIRNMKYRARSFGGTLSISSGAGGGTRVSLHVSNGRRKKHGQNDQSAAC